MEGEFEDTVQGASSGIDGRDARRCQHHVLFLHVGTHVFQEGRFTRASLARQENGLTGELDEVQRILEFGVTGIYLHGFFALYSCHSEERSGEESRCHPLCVPEILRFALDDK